MEKTFQFRVNSPSGLQLVALLMPVQQGGVVTNEYCPKSFLTGDNPLAFAMTAINGEAEQDFITDCQNQIAIINRFNGYGQLNAHLSALNSVVEQHISRCGRLIFNDLLIYVDVFALLLKYTGIGEASIRKEYIKAVYNTVRKYGNVVKNPVNLAPLTDTPLYSCVSREYNNL